MIVRTFTFLRLASTLLITLVAGWATAETADSPQIPKVATETGLIKGSGIVTTENRNLEPFEDIQLDTVADVTLTKGEKITCTIKADDNLLPMILTERTGKTLRIHTKVSYTSHTRVAITITLPVVKSATVNGIGTLTLTNVTKDSVAAAINGTGTITATGHVESLAATINGAGALHAAGLEVKAITITLTGTSNADVHAIDFLKATVYGTGTISYTGQPKRIEQSAFGGGQVIGK
jgi:hypothetical protein